LRTAARQLPAPLNRVTRPGRAAGGAVSRLPAARASGASAGGQPAGWPPAEAPLARAAGNLLTAPPAALPGLVTRFSGAGNCRAAVRNGYYPTGWRDDMGFRSVLASGQ